METRLVRRQRHPTVVAAASSDYETVRRAIEFISKRWSEQPSLERIAAAVGMKPLSLQRLFTRWAGLSPKGFLQAVTLDHARALLANPPPCSTRPTRSAFPGRAACTISSSPTRP